MLLFAAIFIGRQIFMTTALETGLIILLFSLVAICIAILGDHVTQALNRYDSWPATKSKRSKRTLNPET